MAKEKEKRTARILYVEQGKTAKDIADLVGVAEKTISEWVQKGAWKEERTARNSSPGKRADNIKLIITNLSEDRLELSRRAKEAEAGPGPDPENIQKLREEISRIDDAVSKWNKTLENIEDENRISLATYLNVMDQIFKAMQAHDPKLYMSTVEFQDQHIHKICNLLG